MKKWRCVKNWCKNVGGDASVCRSACDCCQAILDRVECGLKNGGKAIALERKSRAEAGGRRGGISAGRANAASFNREKQIDSACLDRRTDGWMGWEERERAVHCLSAPPPVGRRHAHSLSHPPSPKESHAPNPIREAR